MTTTLDQRRQIIDSLRSKAARDLFVEAEIETGTAIQIRALREREEWKQAELAERAGMRQARISLLENPDYEGSVNIKTLIKIASAFDVALAVRFIPFSELVDWTTNLSEERLVVPAFANDTRLHTAADETTVKTIDQFVIGSQVTTVVSAGVPSSSYVVYVEMDDPPRTIDIPVGTQLALAA